MTTMESSSPHRAPILDTADKLTVWLDGEDLTRIHISIHHPLLPPDRSGSTRINMQVSSNPRSADYNPAVFNRLVHLLREMGKTAPDPVAEYPRHLSRRTRLISTLGLAPL